MSSDRREPQLTPTTNVVVSDSLLGVGDQTDRSPPPPRETLAESDPSTAIVLRRDDFVELISGSIVGDVYEIDGRIGAGAMGEVFAGHHVRLSKRVAIKVIGKSLCDDSAAIERFAQEAKTLARLQHPAIVGIEHVGELSDGRAFFVMEYVRGETLFDRQRRGRVPLAEALSILQQAARGLEAAHAEGVVHRDLKPENIFLADLHGETGVKLLDFGLAKLRAGADRRAEKTQSGVAIGTPMYMSPEQARGPDVDQRSDVYALGVIAYELLLGTPPFPLARTAPEHWAAHLAETPPLPRSIWPDIPPQLDLCLFAMLAKNADHRPTLAQVRAVMAAVASGTTPRRAATEIVAPGQGWKFPWSVAIGAAALVGGIAIGAALTQKSPPPPAAPPPFAAPIAPESPPPPPATIAPAPPPAPVDAKPRRIQRPAGTGSAAPRAQKAGSAAAPPSPPPSPPPPVLEDNPYGSGRDQTIDPFAQKHREAKP